MMLHKQNNNDSAIENETNEKMIRKTWEKWTLVEMRGEHFFCFNDWDLFHL